MTGENWNCDFMHVALLKRLNPFVQEELISFMWALQIAYEGWTREEVDLQQVEQEDNNVWHEELAPASLDVGLEEEESEKA